ncbi:MAG TPA: CPBP family glutamic-type intramembrane protease [Planctomycetota bacterium]|nr:CPBP family glutamic-type intramembrane protease [Planctomycetota bacterium]
MIAVVGGTGFLGRHVTAVLPGAKALSRRTGFDVLRPDPEALRGAAAVVNLAGIKREAPGQSFHGVHVEAVERLVAAMRAAGVRRLVHVSVVVAREKPDSPYTHTKWLGEQAVRASGLDWTILRPGVIYGEGDDLLAHLALMVRAAPLFPIVGDGRAPMMPVDARDVAAAVAAALRTPASVGRAYDVVGPDRLELRDVVARVAEAAGRPVRIVPTPSGLMRPAVFVMEKTWRAPLSTRAQLDMLKEGLAGDPEPARRDLGLSTSPFTVERIRPLVEAIPDRARMTLWLGTTRPSTVTPRWAGLLLLAAFPLLSWGLYGGDRWTKLLAVGLVLSAGALAAGPVRARLRFTPGRLLIGAAIGGLHFLATKGVLARVPAGWEDWARELYTWREGHRPAVLLATLPVIVLSEELFWRGLVTRGVAERAGRGAGILAGALLFALAHLAAGNPLLIAAAFACGLFWGALAEASDSLSVPFAAHLAWDALALFVAPLLSDVRPL